MHRFIVSFIGSCKYLILACCLEGCEGVNSRTSRRPGVTRMTLIFSLILNIMSHHLFFIRDTIFNLYDTPIKTDLRIFWMQDESKAPWYWTWYLAQTPNILAKNVILEHKYITRITRYPYGTKIVLGSLHKLISAYLNIQLPLKNRNIIIILAGIFKASSESKCS